MTQTRRKLRKKTHITNNPKIQELEQVRASLSVEPDEKVIKKVIRRKKRIKPRTKKDINVDSPRKIIKQYKKEKCHFVNENGERCKFNAVGKGTLCKIHGGDPIIKENLIKADEINKIALHCKYRPEFHPVSFIDLSREGLSEVEIAAIFEISLDTLRAWSERFEMFSTAYEIGRALHEAWWIRQGKANLNERSFNTNLFKFLTSNKLGYSDKMETKALNMNVHGVLKVPDKMSEDDWEKEGDIIDADS